MKLAPVRTKKESVFSIPILALSIYIVFTFFPAAYTFVPLLGEIRIVLISGAVLLIGYILTAGKYKNVGAWKNSTVIAMLGYFSAIMLSIFVSHDRGSTLQIIEANVKYLCVLLVMVKIIDSEKREDFILAIFTACGIGMAVITIVNYGIYGKTFVQGEIVSNRAMALEGGLFGDPNDLAMLFNVTLPFMLYYYLTAKYKLFSILGIIVTVCAVMLTYSRGGFLGLCAVTIGFLMLKGGKRGRYIILIVIAALLFWSLAPDSYKNRIMTISKEARVDENLGEYPGRLQAWIELLPEGMKNPILGVGAGCSNYVAGRAISDWHSMHNSFLQVFLESGLIGFFFYACIFLSQYKQYRHFKRKYSNVFNINIERIKFTLLSLLAFAVTAFFLPQAYSPILYFISGASVINAELCNLPKKQ
jgi:O-antigen ligase